MPGALLGRRHLEHAFERPQGAAAHVLVDLDNLVRARRDERLANLLERVQLHVRTEAAAGDEPQPAAPA